MEEMNMTEIRNWKMKRKKLILCILGILSIVINSCGVKEDKQKQEEYSEIPDVVSSIASNND